MAGIYTIELTRVKDNVAMVENVIISMIDRDNYILDYDNNQQTISIDTEYSEPDIIFQLIAQIDRTLFSLAIYKLIINVLIHLNSRMIVPPLIKCRENRNKKSRGCSKLWTVYTEIEDIVLDEDRTRTQWSDDRNNFLEVYHDEILNEGVNPYDYTSLFKRLIMS